MICGERRADPEDPNTVVNPALIVELLSPSTAAYDRGEKLTHYQQIPSLHEIVLVDHAERLVEVSRRTDEGFVHGLFRGDMLVPLDSLGASLTLDEVYAGVD